MSSEEELTAEDVAWANMSYSERLVWWVNNKVLSKQELTQSTEETPTTKVEEQEKQDDVVQEQEKEEKDPVKEQVEIVAEVNSDASQESPAKKRKGKKINISLP